ncbi:MAG: hypothetical protein ABI779_13535 [Acidobacteriota bacterium]
MRNSFTAEPEKEREPPCSFSALKTGPRDLRTVELEHATGDETVAALLRTILAKIERLERCFVFVPLLIAQTGRWTSHLTVDMAAVALGVSVKTIRRRIRENKLVLETISGTRIAGIPIDQLFRDWLPIDLARRIAEDELRELARKT